MAAKRFVKTSIDWAAFAERVPPTQKAKFQLFKAKADGYTKTLMSYPEKAPTIDFAAYRKRLPHLTMVDEFEKQFKNVTVPYPPDTLSASIDEQEKKLDGILKTYSEMEDLNCQYYNKQLQWWKDMMPFDEMSCEEYLEYFTDPKLDVYRTPNFWPFIDEPKPIFPYLNKKDH